MKGKLIAEAAIGVNAPASQVWKAITAPTLIKRYLMGTNAVSDWKEGSAISYEGEYNGKKYHDKGIIQILEPNNIFQSTYWSSMGGKEDKSENYNIVTYTLTEKEGETTVMITQDNVLTEEEKKHAAANWDAVLKELKKVVEEMPA